jgi:hypothetical protein
MEQDVGVTRDEAINAAKEDLNFFGALSIPEVFRFLFPPVFLAIWQLLTSHATEDRGQKKLAIGLPRGFGKTILLKLFVVWVILFTNRRFILIVCNTAALAENFITDVSDIMSSMNILRVFGDWRLSLEKDTLELKKFSFRGRNITLAGLGSGSSLRGLNIKLVRPDLIIMDDMQSKEEAESEVESKKSLSWMLGTLMKANDKTRCLFVFLGNMYPYAGSILKKLKTNPAWTSFICGAILEDGESLWPELRSVTDIMAELEDDESMGHPEIFYSEVMNDDVAGSKSGVDFTKINVWDADRDVSYIYPQGGFILIDPSLAKKKSDELAIGGFFIYDGEPVLTKLQVGKFNPGQTVDESIKMAATMGVRAIVVEGVAYQASLCYWLQLRITQLGLTGLNILEINPQGQAKNSRIVGALKQLTATKERIWIAKAVRSLVVHQITYFDPLKPNNKDDILDLLGYSYPIIETHRNYLTMFNDITTEDETGTPQDELELDF